MTTQTPAVATHGRSDYRNLLAVVGTVLPAVLLGWLLVLYHDAPAMRKGFDEYGLILPQRAQSVIRTSLWLADNWWWVVLYLVLLAVANIGLIRLLARNGRIALPVVWIGAVSLALTVVAVRTSNAIDEALDKLEYNKRR